MKYMPTQTRKNLLRSKNKTAKKISQFIYKNKDICCEDDIDRCVVIEQIFTKYKNICNFIGEPEEYSNWINNDVVGFIGYKIDLINKKDKEGEALWNYLDNEMLTRNKVNERKIKELLSHVPLYFLMAFLGYASYKESFHK